MALVLQKIIQDIILGLFCCHPKPGRACASKANRRFGIQESMKTVNTLKSICSVDLTSAIDLAFYTRSTWAGMTTRGRLRMTVLFVPFLFLAGCTVGPDYTPPEIKAPEKWQEHDQISESQPLPTWDQIFDDPILTKLIKELSDQNFDIRISFARLEQIRSTEKTAFANLFPLISGKMDGVRSKNKGSMPTVTPTQPFNIYDAGFDASWEIDLFGGKRRSLEAAIAQVQAHESTHHQLQISLIAELCRIYVTLRTQQEFLRINQEILKERSLALDLTLAKYQAGLVNHNNITDLQMRVNEIQSKIYDTQGLIKNTLYLIHKIMGIDPGKLDSLLTRHPLPKPRMKILIEAPAKILANRPDIKSAERTLAAATAKQGAAFADFLPKISLLGFLGLQSSDINTLVDSKSSSWSLGGGITFPILDFGRITSNMDMANAIHEVSFLTYQQTIVNALNDVEGAIATYFASLKAVKSVESAVDSAKDAFSLSQSVYEKGIKSRLDLLIDTEKLYNMQQQHTQALSQSLINLITLYKTLGVSPTAKDQPSSKS